MVVSNTFHVHPDPWVWMIQFDEHIFSTGWLNRQPTYCWWFRNPLTTTFWMYKNPINKGIDLPTCTSTADQRISEPSTVQLSQPMSKSSSRECNTIPYSNLATCEQWDWPSKHGFLWSGRPKVSLLEDLRSSTRNYFCRAFLDLDEDVLQGEKHGDDLVMGKINGYVVGYETLSRCLHWIPGFPQNPGRWIKIHSQTQVREIYSVYTGTFKKVCLTWFRFRVSIHNSLGFTWHPLWRCWYIGTSVKV